jgi:hypothetical protein
MSTNAHTTRRSVLTGTTAVMFGGQALAETATRGPFTIEGWKTAWNNPSPERVMARIPLITMPDVTGYWPRTTRPVRGPKEYAQRIVDLLAFIPDFRRSWLSTRPTATSYSCAGWRRARARTDASKPSASIA